MQRNHRVPLMVLPLLAIATACSDTPPAGPTGTGERGSGDMVATARDAAGQPYAVEFFVQAHADDWQLFLGNRAAESVADGSRLVFVYTTAGDGGAATSNPPYWHAREDAAKASVDSLTGGGAWVCASQDVNSHAIHRCTSAGTVSYFLRTPDGDGDGQGYGNGSLALLRSGAVGSLSAVDQSTTYTSWGDLVSTIRAIVDAESAGADDARMAIHAPEWDLETNPGDHPDHQTSGELVRSAMVGNAWNVFWYLGYPSFYHPPNLTPAEHATKWKLILAYDGVMVALMGETIIGTSHAEEWSERTIYRAEYSDGAPVPAPTLPTAPANLLATPVSGTRVDLQWTDASSDEQGFEVERAPDASGVAGTFVRVATLAANVATYSSTGLVKATRYWYRVRAFNAAGLSAYSAEASATTLYAPPAPTNLQATGVVNTSSIIDLTWTDNSPNEAAFRIERAADNGGVPGTFGSAVTVATDVVTYRVTKLVPSTRYWFRVRAQNGAGQSSYTAPVSAMTGAIVPPTNLQATAYKVGTTRNVDLRWTVGTEAKVDIWRNGTRIASGVANSGGPYNNKPALSLGSAVRYQVCVAGKTGAANCSLEATAIF